MQCSSGYRLLHTASSAYALRYVSDGGTHAGSHEGKRKSTPRLPPNPDPRPAIGTHIHAACALVCLGIADKDAAQPVVQSEDPVEPRVIGGLRDRHRVERSGERPALAEFLEELLRISHTFSQKCGRRRRRRRCNRAYVVVFGSVWRIEVL